MKYKHIKVKNFDEIPKNGAFCAEYYGDGTKEWYINGKLHRVDGHAVEFSSGTKQWWVDGQRHRLDGPAVEFSSGAKQWWVDGNRHRLDGPAVEFSNGNKKWYINAKSYSEKDYYKKLYKMKLITKEELFMEML